jgi:hypothetical protein
MQATEDFENSRGLFSRQNFPKIEKAPEFSI